MKIMTQLKLFIVGLLILCPNILWAKHVSEETARKVAVNSMNQSIQAKALQLRQKESPDVEVEQRAVPKMTEEQIFETFSATKDDIFVYYVFNFSPEGWIIISADDAACPVIGYSDTGYYDPDISNQPPALIDWMDNAASQIADAASQNLKARPKEASDWQQLSIEPNNFQAALGDSITVHVDPLIKSNWGQGDYSKQLLSWACCKIWGCYQSDSYNKYCPWEYTDWLHGCKYYCPTGCVATAMAQIMKYWMWPPCGSSSHKYDPDYSCSHQCDGFDEREVNFRNRYYDWSNSSMPLNKSSDAIALLMSDIGVAVEMMYAPDLSGASSNKADEAFKKYFRYEGGDFKEKKDFLDADWIDKLVADLDNGRPIWYTGCGWMGCHAFVCDGYDFLLFLHFFHFNWGWNGWFDGWFFLDLLRPQLGIDDYSQSQGAIFGLEPVHSGTISIIYVDDDYTWDGYNDGHTWNVDAFNKINDAIFAAPIDGGTVYVAAGTYYESIDLKGKSIHLYAVSGPTSTIINGGGAEHVVKCVAGEDANTVIEGFTITGGNFPGIVGRGAGMYNEGSSPTVTNCIFINNNATAGGGMCNYNSSNPTLTNCIFSGNSADYGAGMWNNNSSSPTVINCTFTNNTSGLVCSMFNQAGSNPAVTNCIFWNSTASEILNNSSSITVTYSDVKGGYSGTGNIDADPCFVDASVGNYRLLENSSCINAGDPNYVPELGEIDLDGNPRVMDDRIDMGAYEFGTLNTAPVACIVGGNQIIEAQGPFGAKVTLDGSCSSDADSTPGTNDDINDFNWYRIDPCSPDNDVLLGQGAIIDCNLPLGKNYVILVVTAKSGEEGFDQSTIGVFDTTGPVLQCPNDMIVEATCPEGAIVNFNVTATDLFDTSPEISCSPPSGSMFPLGTTKVSCSAKDSSGNWAAPSVFYVTVQDAAPPVITLNGLATMPLECGVDSYTEEGATATDICDGDVPVIIGGDTVDTSTCGTYLVTYDATDASGNVAEQVIRTVIVEDTMPPVIMLNGSATITLECGVDSYTEEGAKATDLCDGDVPVVIGGDMVDTSTCGTYEVTYDAVDGLGNQAEQVIRTVIVQDTTPPEFILSVEPDVLWPANHKMVKITPSWTVSDNCDEWPDVTLVSITMNEEDDAKGDGHTSDDIQVNDNGIWLRAERSGKRAGRIYTIIYQAVDDSGNVIVDSATVTVPHSRARSKLRHRPLSRLRYWLLRRLRGRAQRYR